MTIEEELDKTKEMLDGLFKEIDKLGENDNRTSSKQTP